MKTLLIMAAGMGSRYGGNKQTDGFGPCGEFIMDYSLYDARREGFDKAVFVIKKDDLGLFESTVGKRINGSMPVEYVFQEMTDIPEGFGIPEGRIKPWGTAHAVYAARKNIDGPFAVINADDFYGRGAFKSLSTFLSDAGKHEYCMIGYELVNTLTENGGVSRGVCSVDTNGHLTAIEEHKTISSESGVIADTLDDGTKKVLEPGTIVSMNCWGFVPDFFDSIEMSLKDFFVRNSGDMSKCELYLLEPVAKEIAGGTATVKVIPTNEKWFGVTYRQDRDNVKNQIAALIEKGVYPADLWGKA
ncbi:MAG: nucleotidyltransferase [Lachnospiraceae bacterium]|nr:nucleotidyltransferase [Lachnospiraceae bacterium]